MAFFYYLCLLMKRTVLIHMAVWAFLLLFPLLFYSPGDTVEHTWGRTLRTAGSPLCYMVVFYINYLWLVPRLFFEKKKRKYFLINTALIVAALGIIFLWWECCRNIFPDRPPHPIQFHPKPENGLLHLPPPQQMLLFYNIISLILTVGLSLALRLSDRNKQLEKERIEIEKRRAEDELTNLRAQINPHFLLNTLNNIYALIAIDGDKAQHAVEELSKLLRYVLYDNQNAYVPLGKEAAFISNYISLMRMRITGGVKVTTDIDISPNDETPVAPLLFISLIENAFKHGISSTGTGFINIKLTRQDNCVTCAIANSYYPKRDNDKSGSGIGLEQVARRLELMYPGRHEWHRGVGKDNIYFSVIKIYT